MKTIGIVAISASSAAVVAVAVCSLAMRHPVIERVIERPIYTQVQPVSPPIQPQAPVSVSEPFMPPVVQVPSMERARQLRPYTEIIRDSNGIYTYHRQRNLYHRTHGSAYEDWTK